MATAIAMLLLLQNERKYKWEQDSGDERKKIIKRVDGHTVTEILEELIF